MSDYIVVDAPASDDSGVWLAVEAGEHLPATVLATSRPAECVADVDAHLGHYMPACWLRAVAPLLDGRRSDARAVGVSRISEAREHARWVAGLYLAANARPPRWWQPELDGRLDDRLAEWLHGTADEVESLLDELGYVMEWRDAGVATWRVGGPDDA